MMFRMSCPEKENLQQKCTARWDAYEAAARESGLSVDPRGQLVASRSAIDPMSSVYSAALHLRWEHLQASRELSIHLSKHRC